MTRAPKSASVRLHIGAATACSSATTVIPASGPAMRSRYRRAHQEFAPGVTNLCVRRPFQPVGCGLICGKGGCMSTSYGVDGRVAVIRIDNPPVNGLSHATREGIVRDLQRALGDADVDAVVLTG